MGSRLLERSGHRVIAYDARGHGRSSPAPAPEAYGYGQLSADLQAVLDGLEVERAVLAGASMGGHTALALALSQPERVGGLVVITPAFEPGAEEQARGLERWDALSRGLRQGGIEGFLAAYGAPAVPEALQDTVVKVIRQRLAEHKDLDAVADALAAVPRSRPFQVIEQLSALDMPAAVIVSGDEADPEHPAAVGRAYAEALGSAELITDPPGRSPLAWQGGQVSKVIAAVAARAQTPS